MRLCVKTLIIYVGYEGIRVPYISLQKFRQTSRQ